MATGVIINRTVDPSDGAGIAAGIGSIYLRDNSGVGELWEKTGAADTAWTLVGGVSDHGALSGLADNDHPQYATDTDLSTHEADTTAVHGIADTANLLTTATGQPLDSDLTAIAALTTTAYGRALLELANAAAGRTAFGLGTAAVAASGDFQPIDADLTAIAALTTTSYGRSLLEAANAAALRTLGGLVIGTDVRAQGSGDPVGGTPAVVLGTAAAAGSSPNFLRRDDTILAFDATTPAAIGTAAAGSATVAGRRDHVHATGAGTPSTQAFGDAAATGSGPAAAMTDHKHAMPANPTTGLVHSINFIIDGGGSAITTGIKGDVVIDFACTVTAWDILADQSGSIVVDIWRDSYANFPPTVADTITGAEKPTISAATKGQDTSLASGAGWAIAAGDVLRYNVDSAATVTRATIALKVVRA